jgi:hypothetical protein
MTSKKTHSIAERAKRIYADRLKARLEAKHPNRHVAIEPESGDYFLGDSFGEAVRAARDAHPSRISFVIRIGHDAAVHLGGVAS